MAYSSDGSFTCHTYYDTVPRFIWSHPKDRQLSPTVGFEHATYLRRHYDHCATRATLFFYLYFCHTYCHNLRRNRNLDRVPNPKSKLDISPHQSKDNLKDSSTGETGKFETRVEAQQLWYDNEPSLSAESKLKLCSPSPAMATSPYEWKIFDWGIK
jgi:hypothetical protein